MSDEQKPFTVTDPRHFTAEGRPRDENEEPSTEPRPAPQPDPQRRERMPPDPPRRAPAGPPPDESREPRAAATGTAEAQVDFTGFVLSLASQAGALLGVGGTAAAQDLRGARTLIGILEMLQDK